MAAHWQYYNELRTILDFLKEDIHKRMQASNIVSLLDGFGVADFEKKYFWGKSRHPKLGGVGLQAASRE